MSRWVAVGIPVTKPGPDQCAMAAVKHFSFVTYVVVSDHRVCPNMLLGAYLRAAFSQVHYQNQCIPIVTSSPVRFTPHASTHTTHAQRAKSRLRAAVTVPVVSPQPASRSDAPSGRRHSLLGSTPPPPFPSGSSLPQESKTAVSPSSVEIKVSL